MYRLSNIEDKRLQQIITKEIMNGFDDTFQFSSKDADTIAAHIEEFCETNLINIESKFQHDLLIYKIIGMYQELADSNNQYTFDEMGEWLFAKILLSMLSRYEFFLECSEDADDALFQDGDASIEDFWETSLSEEDIEYVKSFADTYFAEVLSEVFDEDEINEEIESEYEESKQLFIDRATFFPLMAFEITEDVTPEFLFWDRDFLLIEEL